MALCGRLDNKYLPPNASSSPPSSRYLPANSRSSSPPQAQPSHIPIVHEEANHHAGDGSSSHAYATGNGIQVQQQSYLKNAGTDDEAHSVQGSYSYTAPNGQQVALAYTADENGFQAQGDHLPTAHPIPEHIAKSLEQNAAEEANGQQDDGRYRNDAQQPQQQYGAPNVQGAFGGQAAAGRQQPQPFARQQQQAFGAGSQQSSFARNSQQGLNGGYRY